MMPTRFFYILAEGKVRGPFPEHGIVQLADQGRLPADARLSEDGRTWFAPEAVLPPGSVRTVPPRAEADAPAVSGPPPIAKRVRRRLPEVQLPKIDGRTVIIVAAVICGIIFFAAFSATVRQIATARKAHDDAVPPGWEAGSTTETPGDWGPVYPPVRSPPPTASPPEEDASGPMGPSWDSRPAGTVAASPYRGGHGGGDRGWQSETGATGPSWDSRPAGAVAASPYRGGDGGDDLGGLSETGIATLRYWLTIQAALRAWKELIPVWAEIERFPVVEQMKIFVGFLSSCEALIDFLNKLDDSHVDREAIECKAAICDMIGGFVQLLQALVQDPGNPVLLGQVVIFVQRTGAAMRQAEQTARTTLSRRYGVAFPSLFE